MSLESDRERVVETLSAHYAEDHLTTQELEVRFERAYKASTLNELRDVVAGLPALSNPAVSALSAVPVVAAKPAIRPSDSRRERRHVAIMSSFRKGGSWTPDRLTTIRALMADVTIDLREATFVDSEIAFDLVAVMAEANILVPPGVRVECDGFAFMGEFADRHDASGGDPDAPLVRVRGSAVMGKVSVETRLPGETKLAARRRLRLKGDAREE